MTGLDEIRRGWRILLAATVGIGTGLTTFVYYTLGVFLAPLAKAFAWRDADIMLAVTIVLIGASALGPPIGLLVDRIGARRVALWSVAGAGFGWMGLSLITPSLPVYYAAFALLTLLGAGTLPLTWTRMVVAHFDKARGLALGICMVGTGLFGSGIKLLAFQVLDSMGWRLGFVAIGACLLAITWPIAWFFLPRDTPALPSAAAAPDAKPRLSQMLANRHVWIMAGAFLVLSLAISGVIPNLERFLTQSGFDRRSAVEIAAFYGLGIIAGRLVTGAMLDRFWAPAVVAVMLLPTAAALVALAYVHLSAPLASLLVFVLGTAAGVEYDALAFLISRYFGRLVYGATYGLIYIGFAIGAGLGPWLFTRLSQQAGAYPTLFVGSAALIGVACVLLLTLGAYPARDALTQSDPDLA
ncbi:MFS transporter [Novosphingobium rosa]|uniref:MFS transporter n=1 Tax=Novosphingobium rosa TaxID=76978 RepID=UPI00082E5327|nr:MFS transporter [Novosphingobium rosa]